MGNTELVPYETIVRATSGEPEAVDEVCGITADKSGVPLLKTGISKSSMQRLSRHREQRP